MGKNWKGGKGGGKGGGHGNDFASCRGHGVVIGTCDAARERETSKELVNLLTETIDSLYPKQDTIVESDDEEESEEKFESIQDMLKNEINEIKVQKSSHTQSVMSINTGVKGIVMIKIVRKDICPVQLIKSVFDKVKREKLPLTRYVVRVIPLKLCCFPNEEELNESLKIMADKSISLNEDNKCVVNEYIPSGQFKLPKKTQPWVDPNAVAATEASASNEESSDKPTVDVDTDEQASKKARTEVTPSAVESVEVVAPVSEPSVIESTAPATFVPIQLYYTISFKARNHNTLTKDMLYKAAVKQLPKYARNDYRRPEMIVIVEAIKNLCAISIIKGYDDYMEFNLRKFQTTYCQEEGTSSSSH